MYFCPRILHIYHIYPKTEIFSQRNKMAEKNYQQNSDKYLQNWLITNTIHYHVKYKLFTDVR
jgi:hypothetical protein